MSGDVSVKELREELATVLDSLADDGRAVKVTRHGKPIAVLMSFEAFEALLDDLDDASDYRAVAEFDESDDTTLPWELAKRDLGVA